MSEHKTFTNDTIRPHGGTLVNRIVEGTEREQLIENAKSLHSIILNQWSLSDLELIGIGGFSPLTGFMNQADYESVVEHVHLKNGHVWSVPITLPVSQTEANNLEIGEQVALYGEDGTLYGVLDLEEKYTYDKEKEAQHVYGTTDNAHPGVKKVYEKGEYYLAGPIQLINR
ncbi:TPA: sulfate adenylyltransferase, partial [Pseudomonas aeruginosa]|nr:sulfate adenylyltransferase [Pseudomonas aeruginosa]